MQIAFLQPRPDHPEANGLMNVALVLPPWFVSHSFHLFSSQLPVSPPVAMLIPREHTSPLWHC